MVQTAQGLTRLLHEPDASLQSFALAQLNMLVHAFWAEMADDITAVESLTEDSAFEGRQLASLVASKIYYHLGSLDEALSYALGAGKLFPIDRTDSSNGLEQAYVDTVIAKAIDTYVAQQQRQMKNSNGAATDHRLVDIIERMFSRCEADGEYRQAVGIALIAHRPDVVRRVISASDSSSILDWAFQLVVREGIAQEYGRVYRDELLKMLVDLHQKSKTPDQFAISQCYLHLNDTELASQQLLSLLNDSSSASKNDTLAVAFQIAFDLADIATQDYLTNLREKLTSSSSGEELSKPIQEVVSILSGEVTIKFNLAFLKRANNADLAMLTSVKDALEARNSIYHAAVSLMNAFAHAGTASDVFLRNNLEWLAKATNWSKFTATAALGTIHKGNLDNAQSILQPYLPRTEGAPASAITSVYSEGGAVYALGLISANHGAPSILDYLRTCLKSATAGEVVQHGAALGLGMAAIGSANEDLYDDLRTILFNDNAVAGEAAGYGMGLVMLGKCSSKALDEMLQYAHETQHEKIIRGLAIGIALLVYGLESEADAVIDQLLNDADPILRYGGAHAIALAYAGTGNNQALRRLLHLAVSDVNDDVRRASVIALGFLLFQNPKQVPRVVQLLSESYNAHVRYGAALALGIACAGTGLPEAIALLEPLAKDTVDFVRQGACISLAMILIQPHDTTKAATARAQATFDKIIGDKHEDAMAKFGAAIAKGILNASGMNATLSLRNRGGDRNMEGIVGMLLFTQFWYWFPLAHCLSLAFVPTAFIGVDTDLRLPEFEIDCNAPTSRFAYPEQTKAPSKQTPGKIAAAVLSTTAKATARAKAKEADQGKDEEMKLDEQPVKPADGEQKDGEDGSNDKTDHAPQAGKDEPKSCRIANMSRVLPDQVSVLHFSESARFAPVKPFGHQDEAAELAKNAASPVGRQSKQHQSSTFAPGCGIVVLRDARPGEDAKYIELEPAAAPANVQEANVATPDTDLTSGPIAEMPAPFEWTDWE